MTDINLSSPPPSSLRSTLFAVSGLLAVLFDILFWDRGLQVNVTLFVIAYAVLFAAAAYHFRQVRNAWALGLFVAAIAISSTKTLYTNDFSIFFAPAISGVFLFLGSIFLTARRSISSRVEFLQMRALRSIMLWIDVLENITAHIFRPLFSAKKYSTHVIHVAFGLVIAVPLLTIFVLLFQSADPLFKEFISGLFLFDITNIVEGLKRFGLFLLMFGLFSTLLSVPFSKDHVIDEADTEVEKFNSVTVLTILSLLNGIFILFVIFQLKYLFGGDELVQSLGLTYSEIARKGFWELLTVLIIAFPVSAIIYRAYASDEHPQAIKLQQIIFIVLNAIVAISALRRMNLYQDAYGFTVSRLYAELFIYGAFVFLAILAVSIISRQAFYKYIHASLIAAVVAVTVIGCMNVNQVIARKNVDRYLGGASIDVAYLKSLSFDAYPEIRRLTPSDRISKEDAALICGYLRVVSRDEFTYWQEYNFSLWSARLHVSDKLPLCGEANYSSVGQ